MLATRDDRGSNVRPFRPGFMLLLRFNFIGKRPSALPHAVCQRGLKRCCRDPRVWAVLAAYAAVVTAGMLPIIPYMVRSLPRQALPAGFAGTLVGFFGAVVYITPFIIITAYSPRLSWKRWVDEVVGSGHCASCGQPLDGLPVAEDGCRVCPECGSAWAERPPPAPTRVRG